MRPAVVLKSLVPAELMRPVCSWGSSYSIGASEPGGVAFVLKVDTRERMGARHLPVCRMALTLEGAGGRAATTGLLLLTPGYKKVLLPRGAHVIHPCTPEQEAGGTTLWSSSTGEPGFRLFCCEERYSTDRGE